MTGRSLHRTAAVVCTALLALYACSDNSPSGPTTPVDPPDPSVPPAPAPVSSIAVAPDTVRMRTGEAVQLTATAYDSTGTMLSGRTITWATDDAGVATVSEDGEVASVTPGETEVQARAEGVEGAAHIVVSPLPPAPVATVDVTPDSAILETDSTLMLSVHLADSAGTDLVRPVAWTTGDSTVATVDALGIVAGISTGRAAIVASAEGLADTAWIDVVPAPQVLVGAGDIADCATTRHEETAAILDAVAGTVFAAGDLAYEHGTREEFQDCYGPNWGRHKDRTWPAIGNHEYHTENGAPYFEYFGARVGDSAEGWYSFELGAWKVYVLNSNGSKVGITDGSPQVQWLRQELAADTAQCTVAIWHHPRFSSGLYGNDSDFQPFWSALHEYGAELVLVGHDHHYERLAPMDAAGNADPATGVRQFIVGTGGRSLRPTLIPLATSEVRNSLTHGVLKLTLRHDSYDWEFLPVAGSSFADSGTAACH